MIIDTTDLMRLAGVGGFTIDGAKYTVADLIKIVGASEKGVHIHILNANRIAVNDLIRIASAGSGQVSFDLT